MHFPTVPQRCPMPETVKLRKDLPGATVRIDNPATRNALTPEIVAGLRQALEDLHGERKVRAVILTGNHDAFSSGTDLSRLATQIREAESNREILLQWHEEVAGTLELIQFMLQFPKPIVAAVNGCAAGTGLALALACDFIVGGSNSTFAAPEGRRGLVSGLVAPLLAWRTGPAVARKFILAAATLTATEAESFGLVDEIVADDMVWARANERVRALSESAAASLQLARQLCNETIGESLLTQLASGAANMAAARSTESARRGVEAFLQKRPVDWNE